MQLVQDLVYAYIINSANVRDLKIDQWLQSNNSWKRQKREAE